MLSMGCYADRNAPLFLANERGVSARSDAEMATINIKRAEFHGEWNYTISPNTYPPKLHVYFLTDPKL
jgi:hypothetical protein